MANILDISLADLDGNTTEIDWYCIMRTGGLCDEILPESEGFAKSFTLGILTKVPHCIHIDLP